ncbi:MAG: hypothetical protein IPH31_23570 [Lewinellaceae bacterium]|nr:hypothetical protein [Lewinellaceae bacterium]
MHWKFDPFFSIHILHGKYPPPGLGQPAPPAPVFTLEPTSETQRRLQRMGWVFRPNTAGGEGTLYAEKIFGTDGTAKLRVRPAQNEGFSFIIRLTDPSLLTQTKPYVPTPSNLPSFSGRARMLYFDNFNASPVGANTFSLTAGNAVGHPEFASRAPIPFTFSTPTPAVSGLELKPLAPGSASINFPINDKTLSVEINLPENGYKCTQQPGGQAETLYLTNEVLPANALGIVRIFQPPNADWEPFKHYQIMFDKA